MLQLSLKKRKACCHAGDPSSTNAGEKIYTMTKLDERNSVKCYGNCMKMSHSHFTILLFHQYLCCRLWNSFPALIVSQGSINISLRKDSDPFCCSAGRMETPICSLLLSSMLPSSYELICSDLWPLMSICMWIVKYSPTLFNRMKIGSRQGNWRTDLLSLVEKDSSVTPPTTRH